MKPHFLFLALLGSSSDVSSVAASSCSCLTITVHTHTHTFVKDRWFGQRDRKSASHSRQMTQVFRRHYYGSTTIMYLALRVDMPAFVINHPVRITDPVVKLILYTQHILGVQNDMIIE